MGKKKTTNPKQHAGEGGTLSNRIPALWRGLERKGTLEIWQRTLSRFPVLSEVAGKLGLSFVWPQGWGCRNWPHPCSTARREHRFTTSSPERTCRMCYFLLSLRFECQSGGRGQCRGTGTVNRSGGCQARLWWANSLA